VVTPGAESAVYDCLVFLNARFKKKSAFFVEVAYSKLFIAYCEMADD